MRIAELNQPQPNTRTRLIAKAMTMSQIPRNKNQTGIERTSKTTTTKPVAATTTTKNNSRH
ncbi:hypothetical protein A2U01_0085076 [Trifolium medium]|uniref:Uncharacterized protein n=1 Tax=Trifolium medium TaxID=97028 RepID=A0A392TSF6_9FABA|nr:hypothetical protein [Trifolium medium]